MCNTKQATEICLIEQEDILVGNCKTGMTGEYEILGKTCFYFPEFLSLGLSFSGTDVSQEILDAETNVFLPVGGTIHLQDSIYTLTDLNTRVQVSKAGRYRITFNGILEAQTLVSPANMYVELVTGDPGASLAGENSLLVVDDNPGDNQTVSLHTIRDLSVNDKVGVRVSMQNSPGGNVDVRNYLYSVQRIK